MQYGKMSEEKGVYVLNKIPEAGNFEYIYKNKKMFLKVDQHGPSFIQLDPPAGMYVIQKKERETFSPIKYYFLDGKKLVHNFDIYNAKKFEIRYSPEKAEYELHFADVSTLTTISIDSSSCEVYVKVKVTSKDNKPVDIISSFNFDPIDTTMAIWDKKEWYCSTEVDELNNPLFITRHYSVNGDRNDRRNILLLQNKVASSLQNSPERLRYFTKNFSIMPKAIAKKDIEPLVCYEQVAASKFTLESNETLSALIKVVDDYTAINKNELMKLLDDCNIEASLNNFKNNYNNMISRRSISTPDKGFDNFVNCYLPLELGWVTDLDRGWASGMRGSRDCANDFLGYLAYNLDKCKEVITTLFNNLRYEDGWFPRQIPFGNSNKYDLRPFADSGAFVMELVYEYLCYSNDFSLLDETFTYYDSDKVGTGLEHYIRAAKYYTLEENIGEHGLIKLHGGDWLDCLNRVGLKGRGETLMVTCQAILAFKQLSEVLDRYGDTYNDVKELFKVTTNKFKKAIKENCYLKDEQFYRAIFADDGNWYFSNKDLDGNKRVYIPTNAYTIIAGVNPNNDKKVIKSVNKYNESSYGYKLFTTPFGNPPFEGIGKMGTGDFYPFMFENGAIYNHGGNLFFTRALSTVGDYKTFYRAFNYALPYNPKFHPEDKSYLPAYACTNAYNLVPTFQGRSGLCFLTGTIAMIERSVYNWLFGLDYHVNYLRIKPCVPSQYKDATVVETYCGHKLTLKYVGYGNKVSELTIDGKVISLTNNEAIIDKSLINSDCELVIKLMA